MSDKIQIDQLADTIMKELEEFKDMTVDKTKEAVRKTAKSVQKEISENAPVRRGKYKKSWRTKVMSENSVKLEMVVHSTLPGLPHLLEHGHAKRNGGRTAAQVHIAPAEEHGIQQLEEEIERALSNG